MTVVTQAELLCNQLKPPTFFCRVADPSGTRLVTRAADYDAADAQYVKNHVCNIAQKRLSIQGSLGRKPRKAVSPMTPSEWNRFTEQFTKESDPEKLRSLMDEMNRALANERLGKRAEIRSDAEDRTAPLYR